MYVYVYMLITLQAMYGTARVKLLKVASVDFYISKVKRCFHSLEKISIDVREYVFVYNSFQNMYERARSK